MNKYYLLNLKHSICEDYEFSFENRKIKKCKLLDKKR